MAAGIPDTQLVAPSRPWHRVGLPQWSGQAWGAIGATALFVASSCWWLSRDRSIAVFDAGTHLSYAFFAFEALRAGHIIPALTVSFPYPPLVYLVGDLGIAFGGIGVAPPIVAENLLFVPLLALGCYQVGRIAFDRTAGLLTVLFALGSPLITAQFHVFMTDAPETAMVATSLWLILATEGFTRVRISAIAGLAVGLGLLTKEPFAFFVAGPVAVGAMRGRLAAWRGMLVFTLVALLVALPWYAYELAQVRMLGAAAINARGDAAQGSERAPATLSSANLEWYFWSILNAQLYAPLFAFSAIGWMWTMGGFMRRRPVSRFALELTLGAFVAWLAITETWIRDTRYSMPLLVYLAVFGVGWVTRLPRAGRAVAVIALILAGATNIAGSGFGVGPQVRVHLLATATIFSNKGFLVSGPERDGDLLGTLRALRLHGVRRIVLERSSMDDPTFSANGIGALDTVADLRTVLEGRVRTSSLTPDDAVLHQGPALPGGTPPCVTLTNGTGVWIRLGNPVAPGARDYCPTDHPRF